MEDESARIYVGNLPWGTKRSDIIQIFKGVGRVDSVSHVYGYHYAFVQFKNQRKASKALRMNGSFYKGNYLKVEFTRGPGPRSHGGNHNGQYQNVGIPTFCRERYCVLITGLPVSASWQDLKDHMRSAGSVVFANVFSDGSGVAEFKRRRDMKDAAKRLNLTRLKTYQGELAYIRVFQAVRSRRRGASRERTRSRSRSSSPGVSRGSRSSSGADYMRCPRSPSSGVNCRCPRSPSVGVYRRGPRSQFASGYRRVSRSPSPFNRRHPRSPSLSFNRRG